MSTLSPAGQAWVAAADAAAIAQAKADHAADLAEMSPRMRSWMVDEDEDDLLRPDEEWEAPFGPALPEGEPVLLCDVDGALSPFGTPQDGVHWPTWNHHLIDVDPKIAKVSVPLAPAMAEAIAALPVRIVWLTTWGEKANEFLAPLLGWDTHPVLDVNGGRRFKGEHDGWAKLHVVKRWLRTYGPRPLLWVDDDHRLTDLAEPDVHVSALGQRLLLRTDSNAGITPDDLTVMRTFIDSLG